MKFKNVAVSLLVLVFTFSLLDAGTLKGTVKYDGKPPKKKEIKNGCGPRLWILTF